jgi:tRNA pseudouridine65 synthase
LGFPLWGIQLFAGKGGEPAVALLLFVGGFGSCEVGGGSAAKEMKHAKRKSMQLLAGDRPTRNYVFDRRRGRYVVATLDRSRIKNGAQPTLNLLSSPPMNLPLKILFRDSHLVAIDKPAGLLVHRSKIARQATEFALQRLRDQIGQAVFPVHRIDRPTSGVLLFALNSSVAAKLTTQFQEKTVRKTYHAIVRGFAPADGTWDEPLLEKHDRMTDAKANKNKPAQPAVTRFETLASWSVPFSAGKYPNSRYSHVVAYPETGRKHQLRRHFNHMAHPIVGDTTYGDRRHNRLFAEQLGINRLLLVAKELTFQHPCSGLPIIVTAELGEQFEQAIEKLDAF